MHLIFFSHIPLRMALVHPFQGPDSGSPFVDASLPFDQLKAPPDSAFEILMICLGVMFLAALVTAAFLAVGKLGSLQEQLRKEFALRGQAVKDPAAGAGAQASVALQGSLDELRTSLGAAADRADARLAELLAELIAAIRELPVGGGSGASPGGDSAPGPQLLGAVEELSTSLATFHRSAEAQADRIASQVESLARAIAEIPQGTVPAHASASPELRPGTATPAGVLQATRANLSAQGYTQVEILTPPADLNADLFRAGELTVEAKRGGAVFKGRVLLEEGHVVDVQLRPSHTIFP